MCIPTIFCLPLLLGFSTLLFFNLGDLFMNMLIDQSQYDFLYTLIDLLDQVCYNLKSGAECSAFPQPEDGRPDNPNGPLGTASVFVMFTGGPDKYTSTASYGEK